MTYSATICPASQSVCNLIPQVFCEDLGGPLANNTKQTTSRRVMDKSRQVRDKSVEEFKAGYKNNVPQAWAAHVLSTDTVRHNQNITELKQQKLNVERKSHYVPFVIHHNPWRGGEKKKKKKKWKTARRWKVNNFNTLWCENGGGGSIIQGARCWDRKAILLYEIKMSQNTIHSLWWKC